MIHFLKTALRRGGSHLLFLALIVFSLRDVLTLPGTLGHSWDWEVSAFAAQIWGRLTHNFYVWDYQLRAGYYSPFRPDGWFSFLALPFSVFGGEVFSKTFIVLLMFIAAVSMRRFAREVLGLNSQWSTAAGVLYMFSPVVYSRIMAGHTLLLPYALLPLLLLYLFRTMQGCAEGRLPLREIVAAGLLLGLQGIHPSLMVLALAVVGIVIFFALLRTRHWIATLSSAVMILAIFALLNLYWAVPMGAGYLSSGTIYHSGSFTENPDQVNASTVISQRQDLFQSTIQSMQESLRQNAVWGFDTEFDYPVPDALAALWLLISFLVPIAAFGILLDRSKPKEVGVVLALAGLLSATLVSGTNVVTGGVIYEWLMLHAFPVWAEFGNAVRGLPLVLLAYSALAPALLQRVVESMRGRIRYTATALAVLAGLIYVSPFLAGSTLVDPQDTLSLKSYQPSVSDQRLYDYLKNDPGNFRLTYIPPPWIFYPENYDSGYQWTGGLSPHPEFFFPYFNPEVWRNASDFRTDIPGSIAGKLLGLAAVKYVIYPRARFVNPSLGVFPPQPPADNSAHARFVDQILATQKDLAPLTVPFTGTLVFRNDAYLPRIYAASQSTLVPGDSDTLPMLADSSFFNRQPAIFFSAQQSPADLQRLARLTDRTVTVDPSAQTPTPATDSNSSFLFHFSPPAEAAATFSAPREQSYVIRAQAAPFQFAPPRAGDVSTAIFDKPATSSTIVWSSNLPYNDSLAADSNSLQVSAYLDQSSLPNGYVQMTPAVESLNLTDFPYLRLTSRAEDPAIQAVVVQLSLDLTGDGVADSSWTSPPLTHADFKTDALNVLQLVRQEFPDKPSYRVIDLSVRFQMAPHPDWQKVDVPARLYTYGLKDLGFYQQPSETKPGWVWQLPKDLSLEKTASLSRSLENLDAQRFPVLVRYQSDGPATLYAEMRLTVQSPAGVTSTIPAGAQLLQPFSNGTITLDVRDQLLQSAPPASARDWTATRVDFTVHPLRASQELRPTVLTLGLIGAQWRPASTDQAGPQPPTLLVDGKPVAVTETPAYADPLRYTTDTLTLSEGKHQVSAAYSNSNSPYAVESIEVEPAAAPSTPVAPTISFESINPTRYRVHVTNARAPYFLVFSENFHAGWTAYIEPATSSLSPDSQSSFFHPQRWYEQSALLSALFDGGTRQTLSEHFLVNGYANSWRVDQTGSYDVVIEFVPQRLYEGGLIVSIGTFLGGVFFLGVTWFRRWRKSRRARTTV